MGAVFRVCGWLDREEYMKLREYAEYLGRRDGCSLYALRYSILNSPRLREALDYIEKIGGEFDDDSRKLVERLVEEYTTVFVDAAEEGFLLRSRSYLAPFLERLRSLGVARYSRTHGGFIVKPHAVIDAVRELEAAGLTVVDRTGLLRTGFLEVRFEGELRSYQREAVESWAGNSYRGLVVLPTGAGKTIVALYAMAVLRVPTLVVVYTREQLLEWSEKIRRFLRLGPGVRVGLFYGDRKDVAEITLATYQSAYRYVDVLRSRFGLLVVDEAHHLPADKFKLIASSVLAPYRLGLTATPYRDDGRHVELFALMGGVVYEKSLSELEQEGYVASFTVIPVLVSLSGDERARYRELRRRYLAYARGRTVKELVRAAAAGDESARRALQLLNDMRRLLAFSKAKLEEAKRIVEEERARGSKIIVFTQYVEQAEKLGKMIGAPVITGKTDKTRRRLVFELFKKGRFNVIVFTTVGDEGIDVPDANVGVVLSGTSSRRQFIQRLGRLLRPAPGKTAKLYYIAVKGTQEETNMKKVLSAIM